MASNQSADTAFEPGSHDHAACVANALDRAETVCAQRGLRLTPIRRRVLELIWSDHRASKAYDLLTQIRQEQGRADPPTVYRALDFLQRAGLVHHLNSLDAFIGCNAAGCGGQPQFLICRNCGVIVEMDSAKLEREARRQARIMGFSTDNEIIELHGLCQRCAQDPKTDKE